MLKWIACPFRRSSLHLRRSIIFPLILFTITTGLLYTWIERTTSNSTDLQSSTIKSIESFMLNCQLTNETIRSIELAPTDQCKRELKEISCRIYSQSQFFPKSLPRLCPIQSKNSFKFLLCSTSFFSSLRRKFWRHSRLFFFEQYRWNNESKRNLFSINFVHRLLFETECCFCS